MRAEATQEKVKIKKGYYAADGKRIPSVTTVLGDVLDKPALRRWAWNLGMKGIDIDSYVDDLAEVGKLAHRMILAHLKDETLCLDEYSKTVIDRAETCTLKFMEWQGQHKVIASLIEEPLVSERHRFGGTPDFFGIVDGVFTLLDFKTGKGIYDDYLYQLAAYNILLRESGVIPMNFRILRIGRLPEEGFEEKQVTALDAEAEIFLHALAIYNLKRGLKR